MIHDMTIVETDQMRLMAQDGIVVLYYVPDGTNETRLIFSPGDARILAKMVDWFSAGLASNLRMAASAAIGTDMSNGEENE
jgi:hypothetical protein